MDNKQCSPKHRRGESEWIRLRLMDSPTFINFELSMLQGDLHASTSAHHDVYTGGNLLLIMNYFQARTSTYGLRLNGILLDATFFIQILEVLIHYQLVQFISLLLILGVLWTSCWLQDDNQWSYWRSPHITSLLFVFMGRRHMMQPIIFLMLIVVSLSQKIFFFLVYLPFSS